MYAVFYLIVLIHIHICFNSILVKIAQKYAITGRFVVIFLIYNKKKYFLKYQNLSVSKKTSIKNIYFSGKYKIGVNTNDSRIRYEVTNRLNYVPRVSKPGQMRHYAHLYTHQAQAQPYHCIRVLFSFESELFFFLFFLNKQFFLLFLFSE